MTVVFIPFGSNTFDCFRHPMNMRHCFYLPNTGPRTDGDPCSFCGSLLCLGDSECFSGSVSSKSDLCDVVRRDVCDKALHSR